MPGAPGDRHLARRRGPVEEDLDLGGVPFAAVPSPVLKPHVHGVPPLGGEARVNGLAVVRTPSSGSPGRAPILYQAAAIPVRSGGEDQAIVMGSLVQPGGRRRAPAGREGAHGRGPGRSPQGPRALPVTAARVVCPDTVAWGSPQIPYRPLPRTSVPRMSAMDEAM